MPILNVDDNAPSRFLRSRILENAGFEVREAETAAQALAYTRSSAPPDLVLLDIGLPDGDGFTVCEQLKAAHPALPVLLITTIYQNAQSRRDGFHVGADDYLLDPVEPDRLIESIRRFLAPQQGPTLTPPATVITDDAGQIVSANAAATRMLNLTIRGLRDRSMLTFFAPGRERIAVEARRAAEGRIAQFTGTIRPRERKAFDVRVDISAVPFERGGSLEWVLEPIAPQKN